MSDYVEHNKGDHEDPAPAPTWMIGFIGTVLLLIIFFGLVALFYGAEDQEAQMKVNDVVPLDLASLEIGQLALLEAPARRVRTTQDDKLVEERIVIPIDDAMDLIVQEPRKSQ